MAVEIYIIVVVVVVVFVSALLLYKFHRGCKKQEKRITPPLENRYASFSLGGNLVRELTSPITDCYDVSKTLLGRGSSAEVLIGESLKTHRRYAIKIIDISKKEVTWRYDREKNFLKDIEHTNVVRLYEVYTAPTAMFFVMELCTGGHLGQYLKKKAGGRLDESSARTFMIQMIRAVIHCHNLGICHRDIKLQNVLLECNQPDAQVKLVDLGNAARFRGRTPLNKIVGTTYTAAPEVFRQAYDERCDVWSLGVVCYILLCGRRPFERLEINQSSARNLHNNNNNRHQDSSVIASILMGRYHFNHEAWDTVSNEAIDFIKCCLEMQYLHRCSAIQLMDHPWLASPSGYNTNFLSPSNLLRMGSSAAIATAQGASALIHSTSRHLQQNHSHNNQSCGIRHTSMLAVAFSMPAGKVKTLRSVFQDIDRNSNGVLERDEFRLAMQTLNPDLCYQDIELLFDIMDQDDNKTISFLEFVAATIDPREVDVQEMNQAFRLLDRDQRGYLTRDDLLRVLSTVPNEEIDMFMSAKHSQNSQKSQQQSSLPASPTALLDPAKSAAESRLQRIQEKVDRVVALADVNKDGVISYTEFLFAMAEGSAMEQRALAHAPPISNSGSNTSHRNSNKTVNNNANNSNNNNSSSSYDSNSNSNKLRRQSEGDVILGGQSFKLRIPTILIPIKQPLPVASPPQARSSKKLSIIQRFVQPLSSWSKGLELNNGSYKTTQTHPINVSGNSSNKSKSSHEDEPVELRGKGVEPVDAVDDSPLFNATQPPPGIDGIVEAILGDNDDSDLDGMSRLRFSSKKRRDSSLVPPPMLSTGNKSLTSPALLFSSIKMGTSSNKKADFLSEGNDRNNRMLMLQGNSSNEATNNGSKLYYNEEDNIDVEEEECENEKRRAAVKNDILQMQQVESDEDDEEGDGKSEEDVPHWIKGRPQQQQQIDGDIESGNANGYTQ
jgi:calcium-dependent protein kinase